MTDPVKQERLNRKISFSIGFSAWLVTLLLTVTWAMGIPLLQRIPGWIWPLTRRHVQILGPGSLLLVFAFLAAGFSFRLPGARARIVVLVISFLSIQYGLALLEGRGLQALDDRLVYTGHGQLARASLTVENPLEVLRNYESYTEQGALSNYALTKPPGYFLPYWFTGWLAHRLLSLYPRFNLERLQVRMASLLFPVLSSLILLSVFLLSRKTMEESSGVLAMALCLTIPSLQLITLHEDQFLLPWLFGFALWVLSLGWNRRDPGLMILSGILAYIVIFFSFSCTYLLLFPIALSFYDHGRIVKLWLFYLGGGILAWISGWILLGYHPLSRLFTAMTVHSTWSEGKLEGIRHLSWFGAGWLNLLEFFIWLGPSLALLFFAGLVRVPESIRPYRLLLAGTLIMSAFVSGTMGESARLWLYLIPLVVMIAAPPALRILRSSRFAFSLLMTAQIFYLVFQKLFMDFL